MGGVLAVAQEADEGARVLGAVGGIVGTKRCEGRVTEQLGGQIFGAAREQVIERVVAEAVIPVVRIPRLPDIKGVFRFHIV